MNPSALLPPKPWQSIILIGCIVFAEPLTSTLLFPFVYFMVRGFTKDEGLIGFRVGLINKLPRAGICTHGSDTMQPPLFFCASL